MWEEEGCSCDDAFDMRGRVGRRGKEDIGMVVTQCPDTVPHVAKQLFNQGHAP